MSAQEASVNRVSGKTFQSKKKGKGNENGKQKQGKREQRYNDATCCRCGGQGHFARDPKCLARTCNKCKKTEHFAAMCKTKKSKDKDKDKVNFVEPDDEYAFSVNSNKDFEKIQVPWVVRENYNDCLLRCKCKHC